MILLFPEFQIQTFCGQCACCLKMAHSNRPQPSWVEKLNQYLFSLEKVSFTPGLQSHRVWRIPISFLPSYSSRPGSTTVSQMCSELILFYLTAIYACKSQGSNEKFQFSMENFHYLGYNLTSEGVSWLLERIKIIQNIFHPTTIKDLLKLSGYWLTFPSWSYHCVNSLRM